MHVLDELLAHTSKFVDIVSCAATRRDIVKQADRIVRRCVREVPYVKSVHKPGSARVGRTDRRRGQSRRGRLDQRYRQGVEEGGQVHTSRLRHVYSAQDESPERPEPAHRRRDQGQGRKNGPLQSITGFEERCLSTTSLTSWTVPWPLVSPSSP